MSGRMRFLLVAVVGATLAIGVAGSAGAQVVCEPYGGGCTNPGGTGGSRPSGQISTVEVLPARGQLPAPAAASGQQLPVTGGDIAGLMIVASLLIGGGILFVTLGRRRSPRETPALS